MWCLAGQKSSTHDTIPLTYQQAVWSCFVMRVKTKSSSNQSSDLRLDPSPPGSHGNPGKGRCPLGTPSPNTASLRHGNDGDITQLSPPCEEDEEGVVVDDHDIWAVIRPGNVREKIAIFAPVTSGDAWCSDSGLCPALRAGGSRVRGGGHGEGRLSAKRRRRSSASLQLLQEETADTPEAGEGRESVSVFHMVALLEQIARQPGIKPLPPSPEPPSEEESLNVSDMVARLECLRRSRGGDTALRRSVRRVLLARQPSSSSSSSSSSSCPPGRGGAVVEKEPLPGCLFFSMCPPTHPQPLATPAASAIDASPHVHQGEVVGFQEARQRLRQLLDPPRFLLLLPPHLLLHIFSMLPTSSLGALKCCCRLFKVVMEMYGVRPADSRWVADPRYRDDPCKRCKRVRSRGDVSRCRWHHKVFCQALPGGPGYWLCCHGNRRDTPGCNVGLHDNRWVPAFHSVPSPPCRGRTEVDDG